MFFLYFFFNSNQSLTKKGDFLTLALILTKPLTKCVFLYFFGLILTKAKSQRMFSSIFCPYSYQSSAIKNVYSLFGPYSNKGCFLLFLINTKKFFFSIFYLPLILTKAIFETVFLSFFVLIPTKDLPKSMFSPFLTLF